MTPDKILNMTVADMLDILTDNNSDVLEFELKKMMALVFHLDLVMYF